MDLQNIWLLKVFFSLRYPFKILPKISYVKRINISDLLDNHSVYLVRKSELSFHDSFKKNLGGEVQLNEDSIDYNRIINLSTCISGGDFKEQYLNYSLSITGKGEEKWDGKTKISYLRNLKFIKKRKFAIDGCPIFINPKSLHKITHPLVIGHGKDVENFVKNSGLSFPIIHGNNGSKSYKLEGSCEIIHDPLNLNYWHSELGIFDFEQKRVEKYGPKWHKHFCTTLLSNVISINSYPSLPSKELIAKNIYEKSA